MQKRNQGMRNGLVSIAEQMIQHYAQGLLTVGSLVERLQQTLPEGIDFLDGQARREIERGARGLCAQAVYEACQANESSVRERAFENLERCLAEAMAHSPEAAKLRASGQDAEVIQQTLLEIWSIFQRRVPDLDQPAAFFGWVRVILYRQLSRQLNQARRAVWISLETQPELELEELGDCVDADPLDTIMKEETHKELREAILSLKNPQYQQVLLGTFFGGLEESELALRCRARVQDIYLWRCRALKALRKTGAVARAGC